jgi:hypothetical protein
MHRTKKKRRQADEEIRNAKSHRANGSSVAKLYDTRDASSLRVVPWRSQVNLKVLKSSLSPTGDR